MSEQKTLPLEFYPTAKFQLSWFIGGRAKECASLTASNLFSQGRGRLSVVRWSWVGWGQVF